MAKTSENTIGFFCFSVDKRIAKKAARKLDPFCIHLWQNWCTVSKNVWIMCTILIILSLASSIIVSLIITTIIIVIVITT